MNWLPFTPKTMPSQAGLMLITSLFLAAGAQAQTYQFDVISTGTFAPGVSGLSDHTTYQVYVKTANEDDFVKRVFANADYPGGFACNSGFYNTTALYGPFPTAIDNDFPGSYPGEAVDSWVSIGLIEDANYIDNEANCSSNLGGLFDWSGTWAAPFTPANGSNSGEFDWVADNEATAMDWFLAGPSTIIANYPSNGFAGLDKKVIVMQATTDGLFTFTLTAEIYINGDPNNVVFLTQSFDGTTEQAPVIEGCTDSTACNYYELATTDNGSCEYAAEIYLDCDGNCLNDSDGDGVCDEVEIAGCSDAAACNYNTAATDEAACVYASGCDECSGATDGTGTVVDNDTDDDGVCDADEIVGCQDSDACNYMEAATDNDAQSCIYPVGVCDTCSGATDGTGTILDNDADDDGVCDADEIEGCTDSEACNFNAAATDSGDVCIYPTGCESCSGATDGTGTVVDGDADDDGVCDADEVYGCTAMTACNYDATATEEDGSCEYCSCGALTGLSDYSLTVESHAVNGIEGMTTYRLYANVAQPRDFVSAIFTLEGGELPFELSSTSTPNWFNLADPLMNVNFGANVNPNFYEFVPDLQFDSWLTIGASDASEAAGMSFFSAGADAAWADFNSGNDFVVSEPAGALMISVTPSCSRNPADLNACDDAFPAFGGEDLRVLLGQITTSGTLSGSLAIQILQDGNYTAGQYHTAYFTFNGEGSFSDANYEGPAVSEYQNCGCTDSTAFNYDDSASHDDGSCEAVAEGCLDDTACNFDAAANTDNGSCVYADDPCEVCQDGDVALLDDDFDGVCNADEISGCTDSAACNYDATPTTDTDNTLCVYPDGVCETCSGETDGTGTIVDNDDDNDGVCDANEITGCTDATACNYDSDPTTDTDNTLCVYPTGCETCSGETDGTGTTLANDDDNDGVCNADEIKGCTDAEACNYDSDPTTDTDNTLCEYATSPCETCSGETDGTGTVLANDDDGDGVCNADEITGCTDAEACNYDSDPTTDTDNSMCLFPDGNCEICDGDGGVAVLDADEDGVCDADEVPGCTIDFACNYDANATDDDGTCVFAVNPCEICFGDSVLANDDDGDGVCNADEVTGCTDPAACNYDDDSTTDTDNTLCLYPEACDVCSGETDGTGTVIDGDADNDGVCNDAEISWCTDPAACNYDADPTTDTDNSICVYPDGICDACSGETDGSGVLIDGDVDDDGVCNEDEISGCTIEDACNYNANATENVFLSCLFPTPGTCEYCSGETNGQGVVLSGDADDDGICDGDEILGCDDPQACNYDCLATENDGSCEYPPSGQTCTGVCISDTDGDGICDANEIPGCLNPEACNYVADATDETACYFAAPGFDCQGECLADTDGDGTCDAYEVNGCTDSTAANFVADATEDDGSCVYQTLEEAYQAGYDQGFQEGDLNCNGADYCGEGTIYSEQLGTCIPESCLGDLDASGVIGTNDLLLFLNVFGASCE